MSEHSPADVVRAVLALLEQHRWSAVVPFLEPNSVRVSWEERLASARQPPAIRKPMTAEDYRESNPTLPLEVAQYYADRANSSTHEPQFNDIAGIDTVEQLEQLTPEELAARMLEAGDSRYHLTAARADHGFEIEADDHFERREVIGEVVDAETAYVLYRPRYGPMSHLELKVAELRRTADGWKLRPNSGLFYGPQWDLFHIDVLPPELSPRLPSVQQMEWVKRRFDHQLTPTHFPAVLERFRGASARIAEMATTIPRSVRTARLDGKWSVQEHVGHLLDLEELGEQRLGDYLARAPKLSAADMSNRKTHESDHNRTEIMELLERFNQAREALCRKLAALPPDVIAHVAEHPRLQRPMNVPEWVFFMCEHDDHHLLRIRELSLRDLHPNPSPSP